MFLRNIQPLSMPMWLLLFNHRLMLISRIADDDDGYLPANLCINGIATAIYMNASARVRDVGWASPRVRRVAGDWVSTTSPMTSSRCVGSRVTVLESIVSNRDRTISAVPMTVMALLVAAVVALIGTWRDAVAVILLAMVGVPLRVIGPYVRISAVALSSLVSNAQHVNVMGTRLLVVTCWP